MANLKIIRSICGEKRMTLKELSERLGITQSGLQYIINENTTKIETLEKIAEILNVNISIFFNDPPTDQFEFDTLGKMLERAPVELSGLKAVYKLISSNLKLQGTINVLDTLNRIYIVIIRYLLEGYIVPKPGDPETPEEFEMVYAFIEQVHEILTEDWTDKGELDPIGDLPDEMKRKFYIGKHDENVKNLFAGRIEKVWDTSYHVLFKIPFVRQLFRNGETSHPLLKSFWDRYANMII